MTHDSNRLRKPRHCADAENAAERYQLYDQLAFKPVPNPRRREFRCRTGWAQSPGIKVEVNCAGITRGRSVTRDRTVPARACSRTRGGTENTARARTQRVIESSHGAL